MTHQIEILFSVREDLLAIMRDRSRWEEELPIDLQMFFTRKQISSFTVDEAGDIYTLCRTFMEVNDQIMSQYGGDRTGFNRDRANNSTYSYLTSLFTDHKEQMFPLGTYWFDTGLQVGTEEDPNGDVIVSDSSKVPWFPFSHVQLQSYMNPLVLVKVDNQGKVEYVDSFLIAHDSRPELVVSGQFNKSLGPYFLERRTLQITTNSHLGASAFGLTPWRPEDAVEELNYVDPEVIEFIRTIDGNQEQLPIDFNITQRLIDQYGR